MHMNVVVSYTRRKHVVQFQDLFAARAAPRRSGFGSYSSYSRFLVGRAIPKNPTPVLGPKGPNIGPSGLALCLPNPFTKICL